MNVYDIGGKAAIQYAVSEINVDTRYETPKAQNIVLTDGDVDLTVTANFVNELKTGAIRINKQSEDGQNGDRTFVITGGGETYTITPGADGIAAKCATGYSAKQSDPCNRGRTSRYGRCYRIGGHSDGHYGVSYGNAI